MNNLKFDKQKTAVLFYLHWYCCFLFYFFIMYFYIISCISTLLTRLFYAILSIPFIFLSIEYTYFICNQYYHIHYFSPFERIFQHFLSLYIFSYFFCYLSNFQVFPFFSILLPFFKFFLSCHAIFLFLLHFSLKTPLNLDFSRTAIFYIF